MNNPGFDYETATQYTLTVSVTDSTGLSDTQAVTVNIDDANDPPTIALPSSSVPLNEDDTGGGTLQTATCQDPEGTTLAYSLTVTPTGPFTVDSSGKVMFFLGH